MSYEIINELIEKFSCELVLSDAGDLNSLSGLSPILNQIYAECSKLSLKSETKEILKAQNILNAMLEDDSLKIEENMTVLGNLISNFSISLQKKDQAGQNTEISENNLSDYESNPTNDGYKQLEKKLDEFKLLIGGFCPEEIPDLGDMLNRFDELIVLSKEEKCIIFREISIACKGYVENMTLDNIHNTKPVEDGLVLLNSILRHIKKDESFAFDYSDVLQILNTSFKEEHDSKEPDPDEEDDVTKSLEDTEEISEDDMEILIDFVSEARENLDTIEINLIDLEQDPSNAEIINDIFRPFHTIKGVSGFLSLKKINTLAHTTENLLDSARSGDFLINDTATDIILESVDTLKNLISKVDKGTQTGVMPPDDDIDIESLRNRLKQLQVSLAKGDKSLIGEILVNKNVVDQDRLNHALKIQKAHPDKKIGEILVEEKTASPQAVTAALMEQNLSKKRISAQVKVSTEKLDDLVDYAGELVIAQSMLRQKTADDPLLSQNVVQLGLIVNNMQNIAMSMRMIPIKATFMKMIRLVRDLSRKSGKEINLNMVGEDTEIDRNVVDALYEPMVHMIRNSCDHGIESISDRTGQGKSSQGTITLRAYHKGGHIIIEIEDDGKGMDQMIILEKAKNIGLINGTEQLTDAQIYDLIMQPGFSTAKEITDVSGRGVGMDVVKSGIEKFRGQLNIESELGKGTKFTISLPLTLAIIDGMLVGVDDEKYIIPTTAIQKAFKPDKKDCFTVEEKGEMVKDRGDLIPVIRLNELYNNTSQKKTIWDTLVVVVESKDEKRAILIDELLGKDEYVIKSLGNSLEDVKGLAGGAILADGRVGLILDIHGVFEIANG